MPIKTLKGIIREQLYESKVRFNRLLKRYHIDTFFGHVLF